MNVLTVAQNITNDFTALGNWIGVCTGPPGNTSTVLNEATGGTPTPYARQSTTWTAGANGSAQGSQITLNLPSGTYPYLIMCSGSTGNNMVDWCILSTPIMVTATGTTTVPVQITPSATFA